MALNVILVNALFLPVGRCDILAMWAKHRKEVSTINGFQKL